MIIRRVWPEPNAYGIYTRCSWEIIKNTVIYGAYGT